MSESQDMKVDRKWELRKEKMAAVVKAFSERSPVMRVMRFEDLGDEIRTVVLFDTPTLVRPPGGKVQLQGPVITGIRYHRSFLSVAPIPWEIVSVLSPGALYHPNVHPGGGLCLGHPLPSISMEQILHTTWAALVLNTRLVNTVDWQVFNREAAAYVRARREQFPLTPRGLLEPLECASPQKDSASG